MAKQDAESCLREKLPRSNVFQLLRLFRSLAKGQEL